MAYIVLTNTLKSCMLLLEEEGGPMTVTLSSRGQLVIPAPIRKRRHLKAGTKVECVDTGTAILLVPLPKDPFAAARGSLKGVLSSADVITARREERARAQIRSQRHAG